MASFEAQPSESSSSSSAKGNADTPINKRTSIGLSARRPTAPDTVQRPPDAGGGLSAWWVVFWLIMLMIAVSFLIASRIVQPGATWEDVAASMERPASQPTVTTYFFQDTFTTDSGLLTAFARPGAAAAMVLPAEGVYRLDVWPGSLAWSRFRIENIGALRLEAEATIDEQTPEAAVALIGRFEDDANFYLFTVDGKGRFGAVRYQDGSVTVLRPPTPLPALNLAGASNRLTLEDSGAALRFLGNGILLEAISSESTPERIGVGALATGDDLVTVTFNSITILQP